MKGISHIRGITNVKSIHSVGAGSIPKVQRSSCLELYLLRREKDRLEKEIFTLNKRTSTTKRQLDNINGRVEKLQKETQQEHEIKTCRDIPTRPLKTVHVNY
jgi:hypothetical protein